MTENQPPEAASTTTAPTTSDQPGRPYYENLRGTLRSTLAKKRTLDEQLAALEDNIYKLETSYLEETSNAGNIVRGFDNWVKGVVVGTDKGGRDDRKTRARVRDEDRIFSRSSMAWVRAQETPADSSNANTPSHAPTPTSSIPPSLSARNSDMATPTVKSAGAAKKKKALEKEEEDEGKPAKRSKVSYGRG